MTFRGSKRVRNIIINSGLINLNGVTSLYCWEDECYFHYEAIRTNVAPSRYEVQITKSGENWRCRPIYSDSIISEWSSWNKISSLEEYCKTCQSGVNHSEGLHIYEVNLSKDTKVDQVSAHIAADLLRDLLKMENKECGKYEIKYEIVEKG